MSLKENMEALKDELNTEEKFFESAIRTERFIKRYQKPLMVSVVSLLFAVGGAIAYQAYDDSRIARSNAALNTLLLNPGDKQALQTLEENNRPLSELYQLSTAVKESDTKALQSLQQSQSPEIADLAAYEAAVLSKNSQSLETYTKKQGAFYQEMALLELAVMSIQKGNIKDAQDKLSLIKDDSSVYPVAQMLSHYGVKQ